MRRGRTLRGHAGRHRQGLGHAPARLRGRSRVPVRSGRGAGELPVRRVPGRARPRSTGRAGSTRGLGGRRRTAPWRLGPEHHLGRRPPSRHLPVGSHAALVRRGRAEHLERGPGRSADPDQSDSFVGRDSPGSRRPSVRSGQRWNLWWCTATAVATATAPEARTACAGPPHISAFAARSSSDPAAERSAGTDPEAAARSIASVAEVGRGAAVEMRRILQVLDAGGSSADFAPQPTLADLDVLIERFRAAGLEVDVGQAGGAAVMDPGMELAVVRIVQEALTNVLKHAGGARAQVSLRFGDEVTIEVSDDGPGRAPRSLEGSSASRGRGLVGMSERVEALGGTLLPKEVQ